VTPVKVKTRWSSHRRGRHTN